MPASLAPAAETARIAIFSPASAKRPWRPELVPRDNGSVRAFLLLLSFLFATVARADPGCSDLAALEAAAYRGRLSDTEKVCLEAELATADPVARVDISFVLILHAYMTAEQETYVALMRRHLAQIHTTDPEVAYLYSTWLMKNQPTNHDEILQWAAVAMEGRTRWLDDRVGYVTIVRSIYDMLIQASMQRAIAYEQAYNADPNDATLQRLDRARRLARYYLVIATPCLHYGDCGPKFEVEIEGQTSCEDLEALHAKALVKRLHGDEVSCLKARWYRSQKPKFLDVLMTNADRDSEGTEWESLLAWHWNATAADDPVLAARHAQFLYRGGQNQLEVEIARWSELALSDRAALEKRLGRAGLGEMLQLRAESTRKLVEQAESAALMMPSEAATARVEHTRATASAAAADLKSFCTTYPKDCPQPP